MNFSKSVQDALLANAAAQAHTMALPYEELAKSIALAVEAQKAHTGKAKEERNSLWGAFKRALSIGLAAGHNVSALRVGLEVACEEQKVPQGSIRSYINTIENMYREVQEEKLTLIAAEKLSIADARKRYRVVSDDEKVRRDLLDVVKGWKAEEIAALITLAKGEADDGDIEIVQDMAEAHKAEREAAEAKEAGEVKDVPVAQAA
jgi:hypothetical protein